MKMLNRRRQTLEEDAGRTASGNRLTSLQVCMQLALICACVVILFFGLAVSSVGVWGYFAQERYLSITEPERNPELTRLPYSMMVTGIFVAVLGLIGVAGSVFSRTITGQTLLGVFSFVLVLVIVSEVGAGAAAIKLRHEMRSVFVSTAAESQMEYVRDDKVKEKWDAFQHKYKCCGARGYYDDKTPYWDVFHNDSVPTSCCIDADDTRCEGYASNATLHREFLHKDGCPAVVVDNLTRMAVVTAIIAITIGSTQLLAVLLAVAVAYTSSRLDQKRTNSYSYNQLLQEETGQTIPT